MEKIIFTHNGQAYPPILNGCADAAKQIIYTDDPTDKLLAYAMIAGYLSHCIVGLTSLLF